MVMSTGIVAVTTGLLRDCVFVKAVCCMSCTLFYVVRVHVGVTARRV